MKAKFLPKGRLFGALIVLTIAGCASEPTPPDIGHIVRRTSPSSFQNRCDLKITTHNKTNATFLGVNTQFVLLDASGNLSADIRYFVHGALLPNHGMTVERTVDKPCGDLVAIKVLYLSLPVPTGYYQPRRLITEIR